VCGVRGGVGICPCKLHGLPPNQVDIAAVIEIGSQLSPIIGSGTGFEPVVAGKFAPVEQRGVVKDEALCIQINEGVRTELLIWTQDDLPDRLKHNGSKACLGKERIAIIDSNTGGECAKKSLILTREKILLRCVEIGRPAEGRRKSVDIGCV